MQARNSGYAEVSNTFLACSAALAFASDDGTDPLVREGAEIFTNCMACHGEAGQDNEAPRLAGQHGWYLVTQLENFRAGIRGAHKEDGNGQMMRAIAIGLSDKDIEAVVAYIATLDAE